MSDPVLALILFVALMALLTAAWWFRNLDNGLWRDAHIPLLAGAISGVAVRFVTAAPFAVVAGIGLTLAALYIRLTGRESEPADGMAIGAMTGAAAAVPLTLTSEGDLLRLSGCVLAGSIAGYGITFGLSSVRRPVRQAAIDALTAAAAVGGAWLPSVAARHARVSDRDAALVSSAIVPLILVATAFRQWPHIREELREEAALGVIDDEDVAPTAHPLRRLGRAGWHDAGAHREFVRAANAIALRKRQQRNRPEEIARLYQLEVIKLRNEMQMMTAIDRRMRAASAAADPAQP